MQNPPAPALRSFIDVAPDSHFPIQNLPYGIFIPQPGELPRVGVAIGEYVLDLAVLAERGLLDGPQLRGQRVFDQETLNAFIALGPAAWNEARAQITHVLRHDVALLRDDVALRDMALIPQTAVELCRPVRPGGFTDFYASREHAETVGRLFRGPEAKLPPQYLHLPIGYHGRTSSIVVSGAPIVRPTGQFLPADATAPTFGPSRQLDFELEVGLLVGRGNAQGRPIPMNRAPNQMFGLVLVNDWSARDIQAWEYVPLGPFLGKNFATTISPWVVPLAALEPFRCEAPRQDPPPLPYLQTRGPQTWNLHLEVRLQAAGAAAPTTISRTNFRGMYWTLIQQLVHHTVGGCNLEPGDLLASGTVSGSAPDARGCLLELTERGTRPLQLAPGITRTWLDDGDTVTLTGWCAGDGYRVGFGECRGSITAAAPHEA